MTETSRLEIIIDTTKAKKDTDDVTKSLKGVETQGDKTERSVKDTAKVISDAGDKSKSSAKKVDDLSKSLSTAGNEAKTTSGKMSELRNTMAQAANDGKFGSHVQGLSTKLSGLKGGALLVGASLAGAFVGGVAVASGYLANMALEVAKSNVELARFSAIANTSIANFQGLAGAAATFGVSQEKTSDMLKDFNEKIGEFNAIGAGGAVDFFEQIAVKTEGGAQGAKKLAEEMSKMDGIDALQTYVDKLEEAGVNQKEMSFYLESMGSDLTALAPLLEDGGKLWKDYQKAMEDAGVTTSEDAIQKSIELAAQQESLQMRFGALKSELANQVMPVLSKIINLFMDGSDQGGQFSGVIEGIGFAAKGVGVLIVGLATGMKNLVELMSLVVNQFKTIGTTAVNFANADGIKAKGSALLSGAKDFVWGNGAKAVSNIYSNSKQGFSAMGGILSSKPGQYDALTQAIINNRNAQLKYNREQGRGVGGGAEQNKNLFPTAKTPKTPKAKKDNSTTKAMNEAKRLAEQQRREAERLQAEIERAKERVVKEYASKEEKLLIDYNESKKEIEKGFVNDPTNRDAYLKKAKDTYEKELAAYRSAQKDKLESYQRDFADKTYSATSAIGLSNVGAVYGKDSLKYKMASLSTNLYDKQREESQNYDDDVKDINADYDTPELAGERYALLEEAKRAHMLRMQQLDVEHNESSKELVMQQYQMQLSSFSSLAGSLQGLVSESSSAYAALYAVQKGFNFAQAVMNGYTAISAAWASAPFPYNMPAVAMATMETGVLQAAISAVTPGFKSGGYTGNYGVNQEAGVVHGQEYVLNAEATKRVGINTLNAINNGGTIQAEKVAQASAKSQQSSSNGMQGLTIINQIEQDDLVGNYMRGATGGQILLNQIKANPSEFKRALGV
ncbi:phage tail tape measure protein [Acinetobacter johnsonii]|uniref:phage tail tape measure protein n=1 Tax=Acinetobacter johnsonii TaxID=40214 RepID=UPI00132A9712|nr:phage tail tape measure protein [Acinetobacter johnsonii]MWC17517.1 phage tail tape measure protein [Acinetobacter johnsonii]